MMKRAAVLLGIAFLALIRPSAPALAGGLVMSIDDVTGPTVGLGTFEVLLSNTEPSGGQSFDVASFSFELMVPSSSGIQFTGATTSTSGASYIFDGTGGASIDPSFTLSPDPFPNAGFSGSDTEFTFASINIAPGDTFGLGFAFYAVQPGAPAGDVAISLVSDGTSLSDATGARIDFQADASKGIIHVAGASVPEPTSLLLISIGLAPTLAAVGRRWRGCRRIRVLRTWP